jgi:hypothetical protein
MKAAAFTPLHESLCNDFLGIQNHFSRGTPASASLHPAVSRATFIKLQRCNGESPYIRSRNCGEFLRIALSNWA